MKYVYVSTKRHLRQCSKQHYLCPNLESTQISTNSKMDKYSCTEILYNHENEEIIAVHNIMDKSHEQDIEEKKQKQKNTKFKYIHN